MLPNDFRDGPQPCSSTALVANIACSGQLGSALQLALHSLIKSSAEIEEDESAKQDASVVGTTNDGDDDDDATTLSMKLDDDFSNTIVKAFGNAVATTPWKRDGDFAQFNPPAALLRGRLDHYNRVGGQWRIMVKDAEISPRVPLDGKNKKRGRTSLWQASLTSTDAKKRQYGRNIDLLQTPVQILAYDDL